MRANNLGFMIMILAVITSGGCFSQQDDGRANQEDRQAYAAGKFYTDDPVALEKELRSLYLKAESKQYNNVMAVISPHAGYMFSGEVAASAFNQLDENIKYDRVFVIASSHRVAFPGASVYCKGDYLTPLGRVEVDLEFAQKLVDENDVFTFRKDAHLYEHSLEVQLPLLQYKLGDDFRLIPIVIGTQNMQDCREIAKVLKSYLGGNNLFVISTDFSHYPPYEDAVEIDALTASAIETGSPAKLAEVLQSNNRKGISNLATSLCGWSSVYSLLYMLEGNPGYEIHKLKYKNSGDAAYYGDKERVVGYWAMVVTGETPVNAGSADAFEINTHDQEVLLGIARETLNDYIRQGKYPDFDSRDLPSVCREKCGAFVTLLKEGQLRGCIGRFDADEPLFKVVRDMAISASTRDYRFPPVQADELDEIEIEISVLTPMVKISSIEEIELGKHGIYIKKGASGGTFLPQVATQTGWTREEFLGHCARDKARIGWDGWKDADIYVYEARVFSESGH